MKLKAPEYLVRFAHHLEQLIGNRRDESCGFHIYLITLALMAVALLLRLAIAPVEAGLQYVTFFPAVTLAAVIGGFRPGILATIIGLFFATFIFTPPYYSFSLVAVHSSIWSNLVFLMDGLIVSYAIDVMHRYRRNLLTQIRKIIKVEEKNKGLVLLQQITSQAPGIVYQFRLRPDGSSCFPFASEAIREIYRVSPEEACEDASKVFAILHPNDSDGVVTAIEASARDLAPWRHEYRVKYDDGTVRWLFGDAVPQREADGSVLWNGFITDITARKQTEENLLKLNETLEARVNERTAALAIAKDEAERSNRIKSEFLSHMSHEFRTPLNAILGFTQLIEMDALASGEDKTIENVHDVLKSGRHLLALVNDVLDFARLGSGKLKIEPSQTNLLMSAIDSIGAVRTLAETRKIEVRLVNKLLENHGEIWADPLRTKQVLLNLLSNAIKYNNEGGSIVVALETLNSEFVRLSVQDSGIGIPEEKIGELFLPFSRLHASDACVEGAGIGLSIAKDLVEMMGGRIGAKSVSGEGTTFWIDMATYTGQAHTETDLLQPFSNPQLS